MHVGGYVVPPCCASGQRLAELMIDHDVGASARETYAVKRVGSDYFGEDVGVA